MGVMALFGFDMHHTATIYDDGTVHVQNTIMGMSGQHHVHTLKGYRRWKKDVTHARDTEETKATPGARCNCGLVSGQTREYDGKVWENTEHLEWK